MIEIIVFLTSVKRPNHSPDVGKMVKPTSSKIWATLTNISIEDCLIEEAFQLSDQLSANEVATQALQEYIQRRAPLKLLDLFGTVEYHDDYSVKEQRNFKYRNLNVNLSESSI